MNSNGQKTILLVEDEPIQAMLHSRMVSSFGYDVITIDTGEKAVTTVEDSSDIDLILMDFDLGKGIDGAQTARQILAKRNIPIVFFTSHSEKEYVDKVRTITRYGYVVKNSGKFVLQSSIEMAFQLFEAHRNIEIKMEALRHSEEKSRAVLENIGVGIATISPNMEILSLNKQMRTWFPHVNISEKPICYKSFNSPPRNEKCSYCTTCLTLKDGLVHETVTETPVNGTMVNYRIVSSPIKDRYGNVIAAIEMVEDITFRIVAENKIRSPFKKKEVLP